MAQVDMGSICGAKACLYFMDGILNRLPTKERIKSWGLEVDETCVLCRNAEETRDHMFFDCDFSRQIWKEVLLLCGKSRVVSTWREEVQGEIIEFNHIKNSMECSSLFHLD